jgi:hypothetical protein
MPEKPPKKPQILSALPIQEINCGSAHILAPTCYFRQYYRLWMRGNPHRNLPHFSYLSGHRLLVGLRQAETEIYFLLRSDTFNMQMALYLHSSILVPNDC